MSNTVPETIPLDWELHLSHPGTAEATWVPQRDHGPGLGVLADGTRPADSTVPDAAVAAWVAEVLEVAGTVLTPTSPHVWSVAVTS